MAQLWPGSLLVQFQFSFLKMLSYLFNLSERCLTGFSKCLSAVYALGLQEIKCLLVVSEGSKESSGALLDFISISLCVEGMLNNSIWDDVEYLSFIYLQDELKYRLL